MVVNCYDNGLPLTRFNLTLLLLVYIIGIGLSFTVHDPLNA